MFGGAVLVLSSRRARHLTHAGCQRREDRIEMLNHLLGTANHHAVPAFQPPDTAARPDVDVGDTLDGEFFRAPNIVYVIGVSPVDENVFCLQMG